MSNSMNLSNEVTLYQSKVGTWHLLLENEVTLVELGVFDSKVEAMIFFIKSFKKAA